MIFKKAKQILFIVNSKDYKKFSLLIILLVFTSVFEVVGISSIMPLMTSITDIDKTLESEYVLYFYNHFQLSDNELRLVIGCVSLLLLFVSSLLSMFSNREMLIYGNNIGKSIAVSLYESYIYKSYLFHVGSNSSELIKNIVQETARYAQNVFIPTLRLISKVIFITITLIFLAFINPVMALTAIATIGLIYSVIYISLRVKLSKNGENISKCNSARFKLLNESFSGIKETKLMALEEGYVNEFAQSSQEIATATASSQSISVVPKSIIELFLFGSLIFLILYLVFVGQVNEYLPMLTLFLFMGYRSLPALQMIYSSIVLIRSNERSIDSITHYDDAEKKVKNEVANIKFGSLLSVKNISFSYPNTNKMVLKDLSLDLNKNDIIAVAGLSGSGKTTLVDLLLGLIKQSSGSITVDGQAVENRRCLFSYVPQSVHLVDGTIRENITLGKGSKINEAFLEDVCKKSALSDFILELPLGFDTNIGENGSQLSGGQKQRIGLARALYQDKDIIILDEATSALDVQTESKVLKSIKELSNHKTIIMISHKLDTLKFVDHLIFMDKGRVIAEGSYDEVRNSCTEFSKLIENGKVELGL